MTMKKSAQIKVVHAIFYIHQKMMQALAYTPVIAQSNRVIQFLIDFSISRLTQSSLFNNYKPFQMNCSNSNTDQYESSRSSSKGQA